MGAGSTRDRRTDRPTNRWTRGGEGGTPGVGREAGEGEAPGTYADTTAHCPCPQTANPGYMQPNLAHCQCEGPLVGGRAAPHHDPADRCMGKGAPCWRNFTPHWACRACVLRHAGPAMTSVGPLVPQDPAWLWNLVWHSLGDLGRPCDSFQLNLPDTVLLDADGMPDKWLGVAASGVVVRKRFPPNKTGRQVRNTLAVFKSRWRGDVWRAGWHWRPWQSDCSWWAIFLAVTAYPIGVLLGFPTAAARRLRSCTCVCPWASVAS